MELKEQIITEYLTQLSVVFRKIYIASIIAQ